MSARRKFFVFKPVAIAATVVATALSILLPLLQIVGWINKNAAWVLWVALLILASAVVLLLARLTAVLEEMDDAKAAAGTENAAATQARQLASDEALKATEANERADAAIAALAAVAESAAPAQLSESDRALAEQLAGYAFSEQLLWTLEWFDRNSIPHEPLRMMEELSRLPVTRVSFDPALQRQFRTLAETAMSWRSKLSQVIWPDGERYTTRLHTTVSQEAYKEHAAMVDEVEELGDDLRSQLIEFQRYYSSLNLPIPK